MVMLNNKDASVYLSLVSVVFLWGTSFAISKVALRELSPLNLAGFRFLTVAIIFSLMLRLTKAKIERKDLPQIILMGFMSITSYFYIQYTGLLYTTSINASLLLATSPIWTTIASICVYREKVTWNITLGIFLAFIGVSLVISKGSLFSLFAAETIFGDLLMLLNAIVWAGFTLFGKRIMLKYTAFTATAYIHVFGALMLLPVILIPNKLNPVSVVEQLPNISLPTVGAVLYLAVLCSVYAYSTWYKSIAKIGTIRTASFQYISPLFALFAGVLLLNETISAFMLAGGAMVVFGVYLINRQRSKACPQGGAVR